MAKYLISFPAAAMVVPEGELEAISREAHAVIEQAKAAGVYVFGGGIDDGVPPVLVSAEGTVAAGGNPGRLGSTAACACWNCLRASWQWSGRRA